MRAILCCLILLLCSSPKLMPCDVFLGAHGGYFDMPTKLKRYLQDGPHVFIDPDGYKEFVAEAQDNFEKALSKQEAAAAH
jgi:metallo-beta-lactamase class B